MLARPGRLTAGGQRTLSPVGCPARAKTSQGTFGKVCAVVGDDVVRYAVPSSDVGDERHGSRPVQLLDRLRFDPLGELVHGNKQVCKPPRPVLKGPTMSSPQTAKGQVRGMVLSAEAGRCCLELKTWHPLQLLTICLASSKAVGQKKPWRKALATSDLEAPWWSHSPWWMSLRIATPFSGSTQRWKTPVTLRFTSSLLIIAFAPTRRCTSLAEISSDGSSLLTRNLRMGWAHDGA